MKIKLGTWVVLYWLVISCPMRAGIDCSLVGRWADGNCFTVDLSGNIAYFGYGDSFEIVDFSDLSNPAKISQTLVAGSVSKIKLREGILFILVQNCGLELYDVTQSENPIFLASVPMTDCNDIAFQNDYAFIAEGNSGLHVINISSLTEPIEVSQIHTPGYAYAIEVENQLAYLAVGSQEMTIFDLADPSSPVQIATIDTDGTAMQICISESFAYIADYNKGLKIVNISIPSAPVGEATIASGNKILMSRFKTTWPTW